MTGSATAATKQALGAYGERLAARHLVEQGMVAARPQLAVRRRARSTWCCATGDVLVVCEVKTRSSLGYGTPARGGHRRQARPAAAARRAVGRGARRPPRRRSASTWSACSGRARGASRRPRAGARLMPFATAHTVVARTAPLGHLIDVQADVSPGQVGHDPGRPPRRLAQRGPRPVPDGDHQQPASTGRPPGGSRSCCRRPTCPSAAPTSTWPIARRGARRRRRACRADALDGTAFIGELTLDGGLRSVPGVLPMVLAAAARGIRAGLRARAAGPRGGDGARHEVLGMRSLGQVVAELRGEEVPEAPPVAPMSGSRLLAWRGAASGSTSSTWPTCSGMADARYAVEVAAAGGHHLLLSGPKGSGKTTPRRADPRDPARPDAARSRSS